MTDDEIMRVVSYSTVGSNAIAPTEWCAFARALLARQPAAIDKQEAAVTREEVEQDERGELLPCPFCGDKAEYKYNAFHGNNSLAVCRCCGAQAFWSKWQARAASTSANVAREPDVFEWLETELSAISCRYHGDPSYDHDAYWMRDRVMKLIDEARKIFAFASVAQGAHIAMLEAQLIDARARLDRAIAILTRIHSFMTPEDVRLPDGRVMQFSNSEVERKMLRGLCKAIRAVPDEIANVAQGAEAVEAQEIRQYVLSVLPSVYYMDPPDGGSVSVLEQLRRMADDAAKYRASTAQTALTDEQITDIRRAAVLIRENSYPFPDKPHSNWALADRIDKIISGDKS